jgi:hypothetical protein
VNIDQGVIYVLIEHFLLHLHPCAVQIEQALDAGQHLSDYEIDHVTRVLDEIKQLRPLIERHPEHRELAQGVIAMYASIARRACQNEIPPNSGAIPESRLDQ